MCSIAGVIEKRNEVNLEIIQHMNDSIRHRGPDDSGIKIMKMFDSEFHNVAIAHNRLSIRDLSDAGHQPMCNRDESVFIIFNGEIYNADAFRKELRDDGYIFRGNSDTEVLLQLYIKYGVDLMLSKIDGMYAICIVDTRKNCIYLIRDKIGEKPLYYYENDDVLMWASEYKSFYEHPSFKPVLNKSNLTEYLMFRYISGGDTLLEGIKNLLPGSYLVITKSSIIKQKFWDFPNGDKVYSLDTDSMSNSFSGLLNMAYESRLVSDVEVGIQLSGGVDSSCLTEYISRVSDHKVKTFGIVFEGKDYSEKKYMDRVVKQCNVDSYMYNFTNELFLDSWLKTTYFFEAPMNHEGTLGLFYLNRKASEKIKVMLCGEGADEIMGGYGRFYEILMCMSSQRYRVIKLLKRFWASKCLDYNLFKMDWDTWFVRASQFVGDGEVKKIYGGCEIKNVIKKRLELLSKMNGTGMRKLMNYETSTYCQDLLMRADKVSMASSIEQRVPYLAPWFVEFLCGLDDRLLVPKTGGGIAQNTKRMLKEYCSDIFDEQFAYRTKMGFGISLIDYFSVGDVKRYIEEKLLPGIRQRGLFNYRAILKMYVNLCDKSKRSLSRQNNSEVGALWTAFSFELWAQMYLDGNPNIIANKIG